MKLASINTKRGDDGFTGSLYGNRIAKNDWAVKIGGRISLFNAAIGRCHKFLDSTNKNDSVFLSCLAQVQGNLISIMGEIYTARESLERYYSNKTPLSDEDIEIVDRFIQSYAEKLDDSGYSVSGWITYGCEGPEAAEFDYCAELCRTIEPVMYDAIDNGFEVRKCILIYFNRLSKLFYLLARMRGHEFYDVH